MFVDLKAAFDIIDRRGADRGYEKERIKKRVGRKGARVVKKNKK